MRLLKFCEDARIWWANTKKRFNLLRQRYTLAAYVMGIGLVLFVVHSPAQPGLIYNPQTQTYGGVFLPQIGMALIIISAFSVLAKGKIDLGPKWAWIPLLVIVGSMVVRCIVYFGIDTVAEVVGGIFLFAVYLACRKLGQDAFKPIAVVVVVEAISLVIMGLFVEPGIKCGGIISYPTRNYAMATGFVILGMVLVRSRWQWIIIAISCIGLMFTGSLEAVVALAILGIAVLVRRDWGKRLFVLVGVGTIVLAVLFGFGMGESIFGVAVDKAETLITGEIVGLRITQNKDDISYPCEFVYEEQGIKYLVRYEHPWEEVLDNALYWRWTGWKRAVQNISPLGHGYEITEYNFYTVHNVPLVIVDQIGIAAAAAWLFIVVVALAKTRWKYAFTAVVALSLFDHYIWTQMAPWFPALLGVATSSNIKSDLIFKEVK